jgi:hypothetical protein
MSRQVTDHILLGDLPQNALKIDVGDKPGAGGASHFYAVTGFSGNLNPSQPPELQGQLEGCAIMFQNGPIKEAGLNGLTQEALLAIVIDRLRSFQKGNYACRENAIALTKLQEALFWLKSRTEERLKRGVEGTSTK